MFRVGFRVFRVGFRVFRVGFPVFRVGFRVFRVGSGWVPGVPGGVPAFTDTPRRSVLSESVLKPLILFCDWRGLIKESSR